MSKVRKITSSRYKKYVLILTCYAVFKNSLLNYVYVKQSKTLGK